MSKYYDGALVMPKGHAVMNAEEMTYVEGGFKLDYSWLMRAKVGCLAIARNEISRNSLTVIKDKELAAEIYTHAFLYYNPAGALAAMVGLGLEAYDKSILGGIDYIDGLDTQVTLGMPRYQLYQAMYTIGPNIF